MTFATAVYILFTSFVYRTNVYWSVIYGIKRKPPYIGGMEPVSLRCNNELTSASSYGLGWYKYAIATQWYQFHTTDVWWFSLNIKTFYVLFRVTNEKNISRKKSGKIPIVSSFHVFSSNLGFTYSVAGLVYIHVNVIRVSIIRFLYHKYCVGNKMMVTVEYRCWAI